MDITAIFEQIRTHKQPTVRLEPAELFDHCIVGYREADSKLIYNYDRMIDIVAQEFYQHRPNIKKSKEFGKIWVDQFIESIQKSERENPPLFVNHALSRAL